MALSGTVLGNAIKTAVEATGATVTDQAIINAIANAVIDHIKTNGQISTVTTCGAGPGTGTGTIS